MPGRHLVMQNATPSSMNRTGPIEILGVLRCDQYSCDSHRVALSTYQVHLPGPSCELVHSCLYSEVVIDTGI
jgi:hypothetical protein